MYKHIRLYARPSKIYKNFMEVVFTEVTHAGRFFHKESNYLLDPKDANSTVYPREFIFKTVRLQSVNLGRKSNSSIALKEPTDIKSQVGTEVYINIPPPHCCNILFRVHNKYWPAIKEAIGAYNAYYSK